MNSNLSKLRVSPRGINDQEQCKLITRHARARWGIQAKMMREHGEETGKCIKVINWTESNPCHMYPLVPEEMRIYYHSSILCNWISVLTATIFINESGRWGGRGGVGVGSLAAVKTQHLCLSAGVSSLRTAAPALHVHSGVYSRHWWEYKNEKESFWA